MPARLDRAAGFDHVVQTSLDIRVAYASFKDYWAPIVGQDGPQAEYVAPLDDAARNRLRDVVRHAYPDGETDGPRSYAALAWAVKGIAPA